MSSFIKARRLSVRFLFVLAVFAGCREASLVAQSSGGSSSVVVSQIYSRGGEAGSTFRSDYVEFFNRGQQTVDLRDYQFVLNDGANVTLVFTFNGPFAFPLNGGQYFLVELAPGANGAPLHVPSDAPSFTQFNLGAARGWVAVLRSSAQVTPGCPTGADIVDLVGYGTSVCAEGPALPAPSPTTAALRIGGGCKDTDSNADDFESAAPTPRNSQSAHNFCVAPNQSSVQFATSVIAVPETTTAVEVRVTRRGDVSVPATVDYATSDAHAASERSDFTLALGTLRFAAGENEKTITLLLNDDAHVEGFEFFELSLSNPTGNAVVNPIVPKMRVNIQNNDFSNTPPPPNPADDSAFFVRQHYHDFLNREPDAEGLAFWTNEIEQCGADTQCREVKRVNVSAAFFLSIEFQNTGFLVHRLYRAALPPPASGRPRGLPRLREFVRDAQEIGRGVVVGQGNWHGLLEANKQEFVERFTRRPDFLARYPETMTPAEYVDALDAHAGSVIGAGTILTGEQRNVLVGGLQIGTETRGSVLRQIAEHFTFTEAERNRAFVLMQYIGYLRRHPLDPPDLSFEGYDFWLSKLNQFNGNFVDAEMVKAFITSIEYRQRFGQ